MFAGTQCFLFTESKEEEWNDWLGSNDSLKIINLKMLLVNHNIPYFATNVSTFTTRPPPKCWLPLISLNNGAKIQGRHRAKPLHTSGVYRGKPHYWIFFFFFKVLPLVMYTAVFCWLIIRTVIHTPTDSRHNSAKLFVLSCKTLEFWVSGEMPLDCPLPPQSPPLMVNIAVFLSGMPKECDSSL